MDETQQTRSLTRYQMGLAIAAVEQVRAFLEDSGLDPQGAKAQEMAGALATLELVRKHWTPGRETPATAGAASDREAAAE